MSRETHSRIDQLFREVAEQGMSRRQMIQRAAVLGISAPALTVAMVQKSEVAAAQDEENPLGVDPDQPLEVVIFEGGYGGEFALNVNDTLYGELYPGAEITYDGTQQLQDQYQSRVVDQNPPDIMNNSGAGNFNTTALYTEGQLANLDDLLQAEAYGQPGVPLIDTLVSGTQTTGIYNGGQYVMQWALSAYGIWYDQALFEENGWEYATTWDEHIALCEEIMDSGMAPWTYQGQFPQYVRFLFDQLVFKHGGLEALARIDHLEEDAWTQEPSQMALESLRQIYDMGFILEGTEALSHTESQAEWLQHRAAFIPCGSWLENEMEGVIPEGFEMVIAPTPSMDGDMLPFEAIELSAIEDYIVFENAQNVQGGKEWLRLLFSQEGAQFFTEVTGSLTAVEGAEEGIELTGPTQSVLDASNAAGDDTFVAMYSRWYDDLDEETQFQFGDLMTGLASVEEVSELLQDLTDQIREDDSIEKFSRD